MKMHATSLVATVATAALALVAGCAHHITASSTIEAEERTVLAIEDEYLAAELSRNETTMRKLLDERFVFNSSGGTTAGKEAFIQSVLKMDMVGQSIRERSVLIEGNIAFVFGTADLRFANPGKAESAATLRYTSTYVKRQGQWRMLALQLQPRSN